MIIKKVSPNKNKRLQNLSLLAQPVKELHYLGDNFLSLLEKPLVAIVGSRKVSPYGRLVTQKLAGELASNGVVIVSGLALGVDSIAHDAAIKANGPTIAVLPSGLGKIYPASHTNLARQIVQKGGVLVSEYPATGEGPQKYQFIARNRIIAAISQAVIITEAASKSGSLHTAEFALEQGIDVMAVPGNITSPTSEGANNLIKVGATPVTSSQDVLEALHITHTPAHTHTKEPTFTNPVQADIYTLLLEQSLNEDSLVSTARWSSAEINQALGMLEINGYICRAGSLWQRT